MIPIECYYHIFVVDAEKNKSYEGYYTSYNEAENRCDYLKDLFYEPNFYILATPNQYKPKF